MEEYLPESFIKKHADKVDWYTISRYQKLSEAFIEKHADKVDWDYISRFQKLSESFIEKHSDKVSWDCISRCQKLSEKFIEKHSDKVNWDYISSYQKLSEKFIEKHSDEVEDEMEDEVSLPKELEDLRAMCRAADEVSFTEELDDGRRYWCHYRIAWATDEDVRLVDLCDDDAYGTYPYEFLYAKGDDFEFYKTKLETIGELKHSTKEQEEK